MIYSIKFHRPDDDGDEYALDWDFREPAAWTVSARDTTSYESPLAWPYFTEFDQFAYTVLLAHFGLSDRRAELPLEDIRYTNPATLAFLGRVDHKSDNVGYVLKALDVAKVEREILPDGIERVTADDAVKYLDAGAPLIERANDELIRYLQRNPEAVYEIDPRAFEELVADILAGMGVDVRLTQATWDRGRDILAVVATPLGRFLTIVECKRYAATRKVGEDMLRSLLFTMDRYDIASHSMLVTTSFFTRGAIALARDFEWRLSLKDFNDLRDWLQQYGRWGEVVDRGLWVARRPLKI